MDYNALFRRSLRLEGADDSQNQALDYFSDFFDWDPDLLEPAVETSIPEALLEIILWKHLSLQPIRRFAELTVVSKHFNALLSEPKLRQGHPIPESWMLKQNCVRRNDNIVTLDTYDVLQKKRQRIPIPTDIGLCRYGRTGLISTDELRVFSSQGGESGLIYMEIGGASTSDTPLCPSTRECFVFNPMTKSVRQLSLHCSVRQIDRVSSGYLGWAFDRRVGEEMYPLLLDPLSDKWNRIGSGFTTRGQIRKDKAVMDEVVYLRYLGHRHDLKDQLIMYDMRQGTFREQSTTGLPDNMVNELLFHHEGHIYLAAVLLFPPTAGYLAWKDVLLYELKSTNSQLHWETVSEISGELLEELTNTYPALYELKFFYIDHELLVASLVTKRRTDGARISFHGARSPCHGPPCHAIAAYDLISHSWRKDEASRLGPELHVYTTVFRPRLDIQA